MTDASLDKQVAALIGGEVAQTEPLAGGDLSAVFRLTLTDGRILVAKLGANAETEAEMLRAIAAAGAPAPEVLAASADLLLIEALPGGGRLPAAWEDFAAVLSRLHATRGERYGWRRDHAFGAVAIDNDPADDWVTFWADRRLLNQLGYLPSEIAGRIEALARTLRDRLPAHPPASLLHGDLWGGNVLVDGTRISGLIDPACYYGHREVDVAMLTLFDHPPERFVEAMALEAGWRERLAIYRLWPLIVHVRLFGSGYKQSLAAELDRLGV